MLSRALTKELHERGYEVEAPGREELDLRDRQAIKSWIYSFRPDVIIQGAAYTKVDDAEEEEEEAHLINATTTRYLAERAREIGALLVYPSTDYVFDGRQNEPYTTDAPTAPLGAYGRSKLAGERAAERAGEYLIIRTSWLFGAGGKNFVATVLERGARGEPLRVVDDQRGSPTWTKDLARAILDLIEGEAPTGIYHVVNHGETTWYGLALATLLLAGLDTEITPIRTEEFPRPAPRPRYSVLDPTLTEALIGPLPEWREALGSALREGEFELFAESRT